MKADKVYLVGFIGAGKSTLARALATRLHWDALDIDDLVEAREHETVAALFARRGEGYFRTVERAVLVEQLPRRHVVVATGGGTYVDPQNQALINRDGLSVWLDLAFDRALGRVPLDGRRPLASDRAAFERLFESRRTAYERAHTRIDAGRSSADQLAEELAAWLQQD